MARLVSHNPGKLPSGEDVFFVHVQRENGDHQFTIEARESGLNWWSREASEEEQEMYFKITTERFQRISSNNRMS